MPALEFWFGIPLGGEEKDPNKRTFEISNIRMSALLEVLKANAEN